MLKEHQQERMQNERDEVDLRVVFDYIQRFFQSIGNKISYVARAIKSQLIPFLMILLIGLGIGYADYSLERPYYTSSMTMVLAEIRNEFVEDQLNKLSSMVGEGNVEGLAANLDISVEAARQIKSLMFSNLDQLRIAEDSVLTGSPFKVELTLYDKQLFSSMEPAITNYLENNPYFSKQKRIKQKKVEDLISKYKSEIVSMDTLKSEVINPRGPVNGFVYGEPIDPTNLYRESISLYQKQVELEASLEQIDNIQVVTGFYSRNKPSGPRLLIYMVSSAVVALFIGMFVALYLENKKRNRA
ncbi:chain length determinant protein [Pontibacter sp. E15-1]|uniref:chain length determinant protein n=1 Tax=Pontibacter sp. E15-1 TaxID=2919918 RepID=UPI001F4F8BDB|nr:chain length determinant protein [Pontibacter sp. E15-1]MCJ8166410.1 chain length determinant protein [Pontibacter sp. E15-1]